MTYDPSVVSARQTMVTEAVNLVQKSIIDHRQPEWPTGGGVETRGVGSWRTATYGTGLRSSQIDATESIVGEQNCVDTVTAVLYPQYKNMDELYGSKATAYSDDILRTARATMCKWLQYASLPSRNRPLFMTVDRNKSSGYAESGKLEQEIRSRGFIHVANVFGDEVVGRGPAARATVNQSTFVLYAVKKPSSANVPSVPSSTDGRKKKETKKKKKKKKKKENKTNT